MKTKKQILFILLFLFPALLPFHSCQKQLETKIYGKLTPAQFFQSEQDFNSAVISLYARFSTEWGFNDPSSKPTDPNGGWYRNLFNADPESYWMSGIVTTDEMINNWYPDLQNFTWSASSSKSHNTYYSLVPFVARATGIIANMSAASGIADIVKNRYIAEAKTLRAWMMYILYDYFGPVNVKLDPSTLTDTTQTPRLNRADYSAAIEKDIKEALPYLKISTNSDAADWGRVNQGTALTILMRLYLHNHEWEHVVSTARSIIALNAWSLQQHYTDIFNIKANNEIIYAIPCTNGQLNYYHTEVFPGDIASYNVGSSVYNVVYQGWSTDNNNGFYMPAAFYKTFEENDVRKNAIITTYKSTNGSTVNRTNPIPVKYTDVNGKYLGQSGYGIDLIVFRYAEVLLSLAEALNEIQGPTQEVFSYIQQIRGRAGLQTVTWSSLSKNALRDSLLAERGRELFCEGQRRSDLIRHGKFIEYAQKRGIAAMPKDTLFPIPINIILQGHGVIQQNPGY